MPLRFFLEAFLELSLCSFINLNNISMVDSGSILSTVLSCLWVTLIFVFPIIYVKLIFSPERNLENSTTVIKIGTLFEGLKLYSPAALLYPLVFCYRRVIFALCIVFQSKHPSFQISICFIQQVFVLLYLVYVRPFYHNKRNQIEIFNEIGIVFCLYSLIPLTDVVDDSDIKFNSGYAILGIVCLIILVNLGLALLDILSTCKTFCNKRKSKKIIKKEEKNNLNDTNLEVVDLDLVENGE